MEECRELVKKINDGETYAEKLKQAAIDGALIGVMLFAVGCTFSELFVRGVYNNSSSFVQALGFALGPGFCAGGTAGICDAGFNALRYLSEKKGRK